MCVSKKVPELGQETQLSLSTGTRGLHWQTEQAQEVKENEHPSLKCLFCLCKAKWGEEEAANALTVPTPEF